MKTGVTTLTPADIERLLREHSYMVTALRDIGYRLSRAEIIPAARKALSDVMDNAVNGTSDYSGTGDT